MLHFNSICLRDRQSIIGKYARAYLSFLFEYGIQFNVAWAQKYANLSPADTDKHTNVCLLDFEQGEPKGRITHRPETGHPKTKFPIWLFLAFALDLAERTRQTLPQHPGPHEHTQKGS